MSRAKTIQLFLLDGSIKGRIKASLANWTGVGYKIPRSDIIMSRDISVLNQSGVYFLFSSTEDYEKPAVYIGQASIRKNGEGLLNRIQEHKRNPEKDYWTEAILFTTTNDIFGPTDLSYLEHRLTNIAKESSRYNVQNINNPSIGNVTEEKEAELEQFIDYLKLVTGTLGHEVFEPLVTSTIPSLQPSRTNTEIELFLTRKSKKSNQTIQATAKQTPDGIVVTKGSQIETIDSKSIPASIKRRRSIPKLIQNNILQEDTLFSSPSYAASFVVGGNINGKDAWKDVNGLTLNELENKM